MHLNGFVTSSGCRRPQLLPERWKSFSTRRDQQNLREQSWLTLPRHLCWKPSQWQMSIMSIFPRQLFIALKVNTHSLPTMPRSFEGKSTGELAGQRKHHNNIKSHLALTALWCFSPFKATWDHMSSSFLRSEGRFVLSAALTCTKTCHKLWSSHFLYDRFVLTGAKTDGDKGR